MNEKPIPLDQDLLMAYVDGELPRDQAAAIEAALAEDETVRETVRLLRDGAVAAARAFETMIDEPVPDRLIAAARGQTARPTAIVHTRRRATRHWALPLAASFAALAVGLAMGYLLRSPGGGYVPAAAITSDPLSASFEATLQGALDGGAAGQSFTYESPGVGQGKIELGHAFTTGFGSDCREFRREETRGAARMAGTGIACRDRDNSWSVMLFPGAS